MNVKDIPLPDAWPDLVRKAMLHVASLARWNMIYTYAMSDNSDLRDVRSASQLDRREREIALLKEEMRIKDIRMARISAKNRPHYPPTERMSILVLKAGRGWNLRQTAKAFGLAEEPISRWMKTLDDDDKQGLVQLPVPVNKYPDFVEHVCWWVFLIIDHFSRRCIGFAVFSSMPCSDDIQRSLSKAIKRNSKPKYIISDKGSQFWPSKCKSIKNAGRHPYHEWCAQEEIKPRFGAIGKHGSIAVIERFIRTMKSEGTRQIHVPLNLRDMRHELAIFIHWYNEFRPHQYLNARTPQEVYSHSPPRPRIPIAHNAELPELRLKVSYFEGRKHLPVIELKKAA